MAPSAIPLWGPVRWGLSIPEPPNVRSRVLFRSDRGHYRRREAPDPQRLQRGRGFVHVKARQAFPEIGRQVRRREQTAVRASRWRRRSCRALPDAPAPPKLRDRVRGWDPRVRIRLAPARSQQRTLWLPGAAHAGGTQSSNPLCSSGESGANRDAVFSRHRPYRGNIAEQRGTRPGSR